MLTAEALGPSSSLTKTNQTLWQLLESLAAQWSTQRLLSVAPQVSFQLSNQSADPRGRMKVLAEAFEQVDDSSPRKNWVDQIHEGQQVLFE